jgi:hypothetical protein
VGSPPISHSRSRWRGVNDDECYALRQLQEGGSPPAASFPVWEYPRAIGLVWIDESVTPPVIRLTSQGRSYPTSARAGTLP